MKRSQCVGCKIGIYNLHIQPVCKYVYEKGYWWPPECGYSAPFSRGLKKCRAPRLWGSPTGPFRAIWLRLTCVCKGWEADSKTKTTIASTAAVKHHRNHLIKQPCQMIYLFCKGKSWGWPRGHGPVTPPKVTDWDRVVKLHISKFESSVRAQWCPSTTLGPGTIYFHLPEKYCLPSAALWLRHFVTLWRQTYDVIGQWPGPIWKWKFRSVRPEWEISHAKFQLYRKRLQSNRARNPSGGGGTNRARPARVNACIFKVLLCNI